MLCWFSELNPELMEELKTLWNEYSHLKEFESKRGVDSVQRLEESYNDAKRLSEKFKFAIFPSKICTRGDATFAFTDGPFYS